MNIASAFAFAAHWIFLLWILIGSKNTRAAKAKAEAMFLLTALSFFKLGSMNIKKSKIKIATLLLKI